MLKEVVSECENVGWLISESDRKYKGIERIVYREQLFEIVVR